MDGRTGCGRAGGAEIAWEEARDGGARLHFFLNDAALVITTVAVMKLC